MVQQILKWKKNETLILFTDGVTEMLNENDQQYGILRFEENIKSLAGQKPQEMVERLEKSFKIFRGNALQSDDITMLIFSYNKA